jgi:AraC family transcriptional regulator of adaptative response/methylated-DNA-[protein]-cysteine methyltransferase
MKAKLDLAEAARTATERDPRWRAVVARDGRADDSFVYAVTSTGVFCRPSCPARLARPENVRFFPTCDAAEDVGFRPCLRCRPKEMGRDRQQAAVVAKICQLIDAAEEPLPLEALARAAGMSPFHFHRIFKAVTGVTPKAYGDQRRAERVRAKLAEPETSVTSAIYEAGFNSNGRFYATANDMLGMKPTDYRAGGVNAEIRFAIAECSLGSILVAASERGICAITLGDDPDALARDLQDRFPRATLIGGDAGFEQMVAAVIGFVEKPGTGLNLPLDVRGTAFQQRVWQALREIPAGTTATYAEIARRIGEPKAIRAVAGACAANAIAVAIPCHRVVRTDGSLSGYRWGVERKRALLTRESAS